MKNKIMKEKTIEELEQELKELEAGNKAAWELYGSELCAGEMSANEHALRDQICELKKKKTIEKWEKIGLLEGLDGDVNHQCAELFEAQLSHVLNETQELLLADDLLLPLKLGTSNKRLTIRKDYRDIKLDELVFKGACDKTLTMDVTVTQVRHLMVADVPEEDCIADGFDNWVAFFEGMKHFYPDLEPLDECTIIYFEIADVTTQ